MFTLTAARQKRLPRQLQQFRLHPEQSPVGPDQLGSLQRIGQIIPLHWQYPERGLEAVSITRFLQQLPRLSRIIAECRRLQISVNLFDFAHQHRITVVLASLFVGILTASGSELICQRVFGCSQIRLQCIPNGRRQDMFGLLRTILIADLHNGLPIHSQTQRPSDPAVIERWSLGIERQISQIQGRFLQHPDTASILPFMSLTDRYRWQYMTLTIAQFGIGLHRIGADGEHNMIQQWPAIPVALIGLINQFLLGTIT